jgi:hypothetical protein
MVFRFFPNHNFFDLFEKQVSHAVEAACSSRGGIEARDGDA